MRPSGEEVPMSENSRRDLAVLGVVGVIVALLALGV